MAKHRELFAGKLIVSLATPVDSGKIQWLLQQGIIQHIQTHSQSHYPNDNVLMMSVELGMANEYVRQLSENTARGLRQKARNGDFPALLPIGYINNPSTKKIELHRKNAKIVKSYLNFTPQVKLVSKILPSLWKSLVSNQEKIIGAIFRAYQQFLQIQFITDISAMQEKYMRGSTRQ